MISVTTRHRPVRIGFLVRPDEIDDLKKAAEICCLLWGGCRNPVIPVAAADDALADALLRGFRVDVLMPIAETDAIKGFMDRHEWLSSPRLSGRSVLGQDWRTKKKEVIYLDVINAIDKYWEDEFKSLPSGTDSSCRLVRWDASDPLRDLFLLMFGQYPANLDLKDDYPAAFMKGLRAQELILAAGAAVPAELLKQMTPIALTDAELRLRPRSGFTWAGGIYFGDGSDVKDLATFWNVRAAAGHIGFCCMASGGRTDALGKALIDYIDGMPQRHPNIADHLAVFTRADATTVQKALQPFTPKKRILLHTLPTGGGDLRGLPAATVTFDWEMTSAQVEADKGEYSVTVSLPDKTFLAREKRRKPQLMAVSIDARSDYGYPGYTLNLPFRPGLTEFYGRGIRHDPWSVRSEPGSFAVFTDSDDKSVHLRPLKHAAVVAALFSEAGLKIEPSVGGKLADHLVTGMGGYEATRVFKIRGVRSLIAELDTRSSVTRSHAKNVLWNNGQFHDYERLYIESRETRALTTDDAFDFLLKNGFFRAGLELKCDSCGLDNWLTLRAVDDQWICEYCGHGNRTSLHLRDRGDWKFRKSGLFGKDNNQEGAIPVILTLLAVSRVIDDNATLRMTSVTVRGSVPDCEVDYVVAHHREEEIQCGIGEAKAAGGEIDADDVDHLRAVAAKLREAGIRPYLIFTKTADAFTARELALFAAARDAEEDVIVLTNAELEPYHPYEGADADKLPIPYPVSFDDMVANTEAKYLPRKPPA